MTTLILILIGVAALLVARRYRVIGRRSTDIELQQQDTAHQSDQPNNYFHHVQA